MFAWGPVTKVGGVDPAQVERRRVAAAGHRRLVLRLDAAGATRRRLRALERQGDPPLDGPGREPQGAAKDSNRVVPVGDGGNAIAVIGMPPSHACPGVNADLPGKLLQIKETTVILGGCRGGRCTPSRGNRPLQRARRYSGVKRRFSRSIPPRLQALPAGLPYLSSAGRYSGVPVPLLRLPRNTAACLPSAATRR